MTRLTAATVRARRWLAVMLVAVWCLASGAVTPGQVTGPITGPVDTIRIGVLKNGTYDVVSMPLEIYVARVLTGEALPGSEPAALQALAIAIRTYTLGNRHRHNAEGFDLCDQTDCQVMRASTPATERAALATAGQVLLYRGAPATVYYSASCGGRTEKPSNVWPGAVDPPYLPSRDDDGCGGTPAWSTELRLADLQRSFAAAGFRGTLRGMRIASRNESGRVAFMALDGLTPAQISGQDLRAAVGRTLGWQYLQSTTFEMTRSGESYRFRGHGAGHGVGMCVIGSTKLAIAGESAKQILSRYFPGTELGTVGARLTAAPPEKPTIAAPPPPILAARPTPAPAAASASATAALAFAGVAISLPEGDEGEQQVIATIAMRERDELAKALAVASPPRLALKFHPTIDAYEQATGQPWFTLGATTNGELQFVPLVTLRERGVLERVLRHQLVHLLVDETLAGRPAWVREGAAAHFTEGGRNGPPAREACPQDAELLRPVSASALGEALARARACFEWNLRGRRTWRDVK